MAALAAAAVVGARRLGDARDPEPGVFVPADRAAAVASLPDGGLRYGELRTGNVFEVDSDGTSRSLLAELPVGMNGELGLLGLAVDASGRRTFVSYVDADGWFSVDELTAGGPRRVWRGPFAAGTAVGGRLAWTPRGRLLFGTGDLGDPVAARDPSAPNGKLLELDPDGQEGQVPLVVSSGWHDPQGLAYDSQGRLWVGDDTTGEAGDPLARIDPDGSPTNETTLSPDTSVAGLAASAGGDLLVCDRGNGSLQRFTLPTGEQGSPVPVPGEVGPCELGVAAVGDDRIAVSLDGGIRVFEDPGRGVGEP